MLSYNILFVGDMNERAHSRSRADSLAGLGHKVVKINTVSYKNHWSNPSFIRMSLIFRIFHKIGLPLDIENVNSKMLNIVSSSLDLIVLESAIMVTPETIKKIRRDFSEIKIYYMTNDNPLLSHCLSHYVSRFFSLIDGIVMIRGYNKLKIKERGVRNVIEIDRAFDPNIHKRIESNNCELSKDVLFIGSYEKERANVIHFLAENGVLITIYGSGWEAFPIHKNINNANRPTFGSEYPEEVAKSKIILSFFRKISKDVNTSRIFEIPVMGGFLLSEYSDFAARYLEEGKEVEFFRNKKECLEKIQYYLNHFEQSQIIRNNGYEKCIGNHSHKARMQYVINQIFN
jgi:spore maturation protein CgeB